MNVTEVTLVHGKGDHVGGAVPVQVLPVNGAYLFVINQRQGQLMTFTVKMFQQAMERLFYLLKFQGDFLLTVFYEDFRFS